MAAAAPTTIHQAAGRGALQLVVRLVEETPQLVNAKDKNGRTPLMHACQWGCYHVAAFLLDQGAAVNKVDYAGRSALQWSAPTGASLRTIQLLLERGADPSLTSSPHHPAAMGEHEDDDEETAAREGEAGQQAGSRCIRRPRGGASGAGGGGSSASAASAASAHYRHHRHVRGGATFLMRACSFGYDQIVRLLVLRHGGR